MLHGRYFKNPSTGQWERTTLAFVTYHQWEQRNPHIVHGASSNNRRTGNKPLPPRNYSVWPVFESVQKESAQ